MEIITTNLKSAGVRRAIRNGREYYVCSASIINPGVLAGSKGALYYPPDECQRNARDWEGTPLVLYHPTRNGQYVSIRDDPSAIDRQGLGEFLKPRFKSKLGGEMWFDAQKVANADKYLVKNGVEPILPRLRKGIPVELSTGLFTENIPAEQGAMFNGRPYTHVARNYRPDHIAILPNQIGACILPGQEIQGRITKASKAWYTGEAIRIETLSGELLSVTPNHPILTDMGFVPASDLTEGQNLLHYVREDKATTTDTNEKYAPALAEDVFDALASLSTHEEAVRTRATTLDFHGDAGFFQGDVQIVSPQSALSSGSVPKTAKRFIQGGFGGRGNCQSSLSSRSHTQQFTRLVDATDVRQVSFGSESLTLLERQPGVHEARGGGSVSRDTALLEPGVDDALVDTQFSLNFISVFPSAVGCDNFSNKLGWEAGFGNQPLTGFCVFGPGAELNISLPKTVSNRRVMEAKLFRQLLHTFPSKITTDKIVHLDRFFHNGPVYDFESSLGYIIAQKLLVSNCSINDGCGVLVNARGGDGAAWYPVVGNEARDVRLVPVQNVWTDAARQASAEARSASKKAHEASAKIGHRTILDPSYASTGMSGPSDIHYHAAHLHMGAAAELLNEANRDDNAGYFDKANMKRDVAQMHEDAALSNFNAAREIEGSVHRPSQPKLGWQQNQRNPTANMWSEEARQAALEARRASATAGAKSREAAAYHGSFEESEMYKAGQRGQKADSVKQHLQAAEMHRIAAEKHERTADYLGSGDAGRGEHYRAAKLNMDAADAHERAAGIKSGGGMHGGGGFGAMNPQGPPKPVQAQLSRGSGVAGESLEMSREAAQRVSNQWQAIRNVWTEEARAAAAASKRAKAISDKHPEQSEESKKAGERAFSDAKYAGGKGGPYLHIQARQSHNNAAEIAEREGHPDLAAAHREAGIAHETARRQFSTSTAKRWTRMSNQPATIRSNRLRNWTSPVRRHVRYCTIRKCAGIR